jgi:hypothetical protein
MSDGNAEAESLCVIVLDRTHPDFEQYLWVARQWATEITDRPFAKWFASPDRGRFIVFAINTAGRDLTAEDIFCFADSEPELVETLRATYIGKGFLDLKFWLTREVLDRVLELLGPWKPLGVTIEWNTLPPGSETVTLDWVPCPITHG